MKRLKIIFTEFFSTENCMKKWRLGVSLLIGFFCWVFMKNDICISIQDDFYSILTNILGILAGFTLSTIAILATSGNKDILKAKQYIVRNDAKYGELTLYTSVTVNLVIVLLFQMLLLSVNILFPLFLTRGKVFMCINISLLIDILFQLGSFILDLYFIITRHDND